MIVRWSACLILTPHTSHAQDRMDQTWCNKGKGRRSTEQEGCDPFCG